MSYHRYFVEITNDTLKIMPKTPFYPYLAPQGPLLKQKLNFISLMFQLLYLVIIILIKSHKIIYFDEINYDIQ